VKPGVSLASCNGDTDPAVLRDNRVIDVIKKDLETVHILEAKKEGRIRLDYVEIYVAER